MSKLKTPVRVSMNRFSMDRVSMDRVSMDMSGFLDGAKITNKFTKDTFYIEHYFNTELYYDQLSVYKIMVAASGSKFQFPLSYPYFNFLPKQNILEMPFFMHQFNTSSSNIQDIWFFSVSNVKIFSF